MVIRVLSNAEWEAGKERDAGKEQNAGTKWEAGRLRSPLVVAAPVDGVQFRHVG
jgi:hypothetical protein